MNYDESVAALYQAPVATFVAERKRLAGELRNAGDKAGAAKLNKLGRPTLSAWVVNQLYWHARDAFDTMFATADRLRGGDLGAGAAHRESIANLRGRAARILTDAGHGAPEATLRRVTTTLSALAATGSFAPDPPGALAEDREPVGFDVAVALASVPVRAAPTVTKPAPEPDVEQAVEEEALAPEDEAERRAGLQRKLDEEAAARDAAQRAAGPSAPAHTTEAARPAEAKQRVERPDAAAAEAKRAESESEADATPAADAAAEAKHRADEAAAKQRADEEAKRRAEVEAKQRAEDARAKKVAERSRLIAGLATARAELANRERAVTSLSEQLEAAELKVAEVNELIAMFEAKLASLDGSS